MRLGDFLALIILAVVTATLTACGSYQCGYGDYSHGCDGGTAKAIYLDNDLQSEARKERPKLAPTELSERDRYINDDYSRDDVLPLSWVNSAFGLDSRFPKEPGWIPYGYYPRGTSYLSSIRKNWNRNREKYFSIEAISPNNHSCFDIDYLQCARNLSQYFVFTTALDDYQTFAEEKFDVNGLPISTLGSGDVMLAPTEEKYPMWRKITLVYDIKSGVMKSIDIATLNILSRFDFWMAKTEEDFRKSKAYPIIVAINGGSWCDEADFYRFIYNDLMKTQKASGDRFSSGGGSIQRTNRTEASKVFCGLKIEYIRGSKDYASSNYSNSGSFEYLTLTPIGKKR